MLASVPQKTEVVNLQQFVTVPEIEFYSAVAKYTEITRSGQQVAVIGKDGKIVLLLGSGKLTEQERIANERRLGKILKSIETAEVSPKPPDASWFQ